MIFKNTTDHGLDFELAGHRIKLQPGETITIQDKYAYAVKAYGLPLEPLDEDEMEMPREPPKPKPAKK